MKNFFAFQTEAEFGAVFLRKGLAGKIGGVSAHCAPGGGEKIPARKLREKRPITANAPQSRIAPLGRAPPKIFRRAKEAGTRRRF